MVFDPIARPAAVPLGETTVVWRSGDRHQSRVVAGIGRSDTQGATIDTLFGRDTEVVALHAFLDDLANGPTHLVLEGEVGAGKTALWRVAVAAARERGYRVLINRATEAEASMAYAALGDLLRDVLDPGLSRLPTPQAAALRVAVLLQEPDGPPPDPLAVSVATLGLLRDLAAESPVLIALDDYPYLDTASAKVLAFVLRRMDAERVGVLGTVRVNGTRDPVPILLDAPAIARQPRRLVAGPLTRDAIDALLQSEIRCALPAARDRDRGRIRGQSPVRARDRARDRRRRDPARAGPAAADPRHTARSRDGPARSPRAIGSRCTVRRGRRRRPHRGAPRGSAAERRRCRRRWIGRRTLASSTSASATSRSATPCSPRPSTTPFFGNGGGSCMVAWRSRSRAHRNAPDNCPLRPTVPTRASRSLSTRRQGRRRVEARPASRPISPNRHRP